MDRCRAVASFLAGSDSTVPAGLVVLVAVVANPPGATQQQGQHQDHGGQQAFERAHGRTWS